MNRKIPARYRAPTFAAIMSIFTVLIVSATITFTHTGFSQVFFMSWLKAFCTAWPIVFMAILIVAPLVNQLVNKIVDKPS